MAVTKFVNLTNHDITLVDEQGNKLVTFKPSGIVARIEHEIDRTVEEYEIAEGVVIHIPENIYRENKNVVGLPDPQPNTIYLVSSLIAQTVKREDLRAPVMTTALKDEVGNIIGVRELRSYQQDEDSENEE